MGFPLIPLAASVVGSVLPGMISAIAGAKTPEQARAALAPKFDAAVAELVGRGMRRDEAEKQTEEAMKGEIAAKMQEGALPAWAEALMSVAGGIGGWAAGAKLATKLAAKKLTKETASEGAEAAAKAAPTASAAPKGITKGETPNVADSPDALITPFGPRAAPRGTRMDSEPLPHSLGGKTRADEIDAIPDETGALVENRKYTPIPDDLLLPFARMAGRPDELAADLARQRRFAGHSPIQGVDIEL